MLKMTPPPASEKSTQHNHRISSFFIPHPSILDLDDASQGEFQYTPRSIDLTSSLAAEPEDLSNDLNRLDLADLMGSPKLHVSYADHALTRSQSIPVASQRQPCRRSISDCQVG